MNRFLISSIKNLGPYRVLLKWDYVIDRHLLNHILKVQFILNELDIHHFENAVKGYNELALFFKEQPSLTEEILSDINEKAMLLDENPSYKTHVIKVNYHQNSADMDRLIEHTQLNLAKIIELHTQPMYDVHFVGFLPGFVYLGGMDKRLFIPRKISPDKVPKGSVAIAANQTGIYPQTSPGGWTIIGTTSHSLFDSNLIPPMDINAGDYLKFEAQHFEDD